MSGQHLLVTRGGLGVLVVALALGGGFCRRPAGLMPASTTPDPAAKLFIRHCAVCHGFGGEGRPDAAKPIPNLRDGPARNYPDERLAQQIARGSGIMPPFRYQLKPEEIQTLVAYVRRLQNAGPP